MMDLEDLKQLKQDIQQLATEEIKQIKKKTETVDVLTDRHGDSLTVSRGVEGFVKNAKEKIFLQINSLDSIQLELDKDMQIRLYKILKRSLESLEIEINDFKGEE